MVQGDGDGLRLMAGVEVWVVQEAKLLDDGLDRRWVTTKVSVVLLFKILCSFFVVTYCFKAENKGLRLVVAKGYLLW